MNLHKFYQDNPSLLQTKLGNTSGQTVDVVNGALIASQSNAVWSYAAGVSGTVVVPVATRVVAFSAYSALGGTITINGGQPITLPIGVAISITPRVPLISPTIIFTGTSTYFVELVS